MSYNGLPQLRTPISTVSDDLFTYVRKYVTLALVSNPVEDRSTLAATRGSIVEESRSGIMRSELPPPTALKAQAVRSEIEQLEKSLRTMNEVNRAFQSRQPIALEQLGFTVEHIQHLEMRAASGLSPFPANVISNLMDTISLLRQHLTDILSE
ncbi:hypothetical protein ACQKD8_18410 [Pseudomonas sp. NPDC077405]